MAERELLHRLWAAVQGRPELLDAVDVHGEATVLPAEFDVTELAAASVAAATLAAAEFLALRNAAPPRPVRVDRHGACAAFRSEALFSPIGWELPPIWDPLAGDYEAADGWIKLHTNYATHRAAAERVLGSPADRADAITAVRTWTAEALETAVVEAGGCAAAMRTKAQWVATAHGRACATEPVVRWAPAPPVAIHPPAAAERPFAGIRVLDLTRVIAGPVCTRFLAGYGADVLRIDPVGFSEVPALIPDITPGKRCSQLDLRTDRSSFVALVKQADVLVSGYRADALEHLGFGVEQLRELNPGLIVASLNAYGWDGPWQNRRGFDSLVQMSCGIAAAGLEPHQAPSPLPAQALDHATGFMLAAAVGRALTERALTGCPVHIRCSLIGTANALWSHATPGGRRPFQQPWVEGDLVHCSTEWGDAWRVPLPGAIDGVPTTWPIPAGRLGRHQPAWSR